MSGLYLCSGFFMFLSIWAILQLIIMGICYKFEVLALVEDVHPPKTVVFSNYDDIIKTTKDNYSKTANQCWAVAGIYVLVLGISYLCLRQAKKNQRKAAERLEDDEYSCQQLDRY